MDKMTLDEHVSHNENMKINPTLTYAEHKNNPETIDQQNGKEITMVHNKEDSSNCPQPGADQDDYLMEQGGDASLKDRYGKPKQHGTLWEPPVVYINTELSVPKSSPNKQPFESSALEHSRYHDHQRPSSPKNPKASCQCCHPETIHYRHHTEATSRHHSGSSSHHMPYESDHHEVFYMPVDSEERNKHHYAMRHACNCSSCQKGKIESLPSHAGHTSHVSKDRREGSMHDSLRLLLPEPGSRPVSFQFLFL